MKNIFKKLVLLVIFFSYTLSSPSKDDNKKWNVNFSRNREPLLFYGQWEGHSYYPSPDDWRKESVYQFVTDRFADGNPLNNEGKYGGYNLYEIGTRHGGDFKGITNKLDYIKATGFTAIWISPIFQNLENSYHGYAQIDFTLLDDRFGTLEEFQELVTEAHKRDIKVIVDIVVNHMADLFYFEGYKEPGQNAPFHMHTGEYQLFWRNESRQYTDFHINNTFYSYDSYPDVYSSEGVCIQDEGEGSFWFSDFHHNGDLRNYGDTWENILGKIYGSMDDLRTTGIRLQDKIIEMTKSLLSSTDIDGIRMDTPMQVPLLFFQHWAPSVKEHAESLGKKNFIIFGEFYCSREKAATMTNRGKAVDENKEKYIIVEEIYTMDGGIHYPFYQWHSESVKEQKNNIRGILDLYNSDLRDYDWYNPRHGKNEYRHLHFFDNHDQCRLAESNDGFKKTDLSTGIIAFWPGIPLFYYGDEQGLFTKGTALDGWSREDFMTSLAWKSYPTIDGKNPAEIDNFDMTNPHFKWVRNVMNVRANYRNLLDCDTITERWVQNGNTNGIFAFTRQCGEEKDWVLVMFNTWSSQLGVFNMKTGWKSNQKIINTLNPKETYSLQTDGTMSISLNGYEVKAFVLDKSYNPVNLWIDSITPKHDEAIVKKNDEKIQVIIRFSEDIEVGISVYSNIKFNGVVIPHSAVKSLIPSTLVLSLTPKEGINFIELLTGIKAKQSGKPLYSKFISRFRYGTTNNIIVNSDAKEDANLLSFYGDKSIKIHHKANGSEKFRVYGKYKNSKDYVLVNNWADYKQETEISLVDIQNMEKIKVQYYVDNSAAYFVEGPVSHSLRMLN